MKNVGSLLLAVWLILYGLKNVVSLSFQYDYIVLGAVALIAGVLLILKR